jgi:hypothetical protein
MTNNVNVYSQQGCVGCKPCERGARNIARTGCLWILVPISYGLVIALSKKCQYCGHRSVFNRHFGPDTRRSGGF